MSEDDLEVQDNFGDTALLETTYSGQYKMAECMLRKNKSLVSMGRANTDGFHMLPVVMALSNGYIKMARYLYSLTPLEDLIPEKGRSGSTLCTQAIYTRALDIALDLIRRCPRLVLAPDKESYSPLYALAAMGYAFPSGHRLVFWKRWIYSCEYTPTLLSVTPYFPSLSSNCSSIIMSTAILIDHELKYYS
ncbi:hypothetical protein F2P56_007770 [Juglans regia]|nr:hypothetical protein F2P56_007770 [Juglans regia]